MFKGPWMRGLPALLLAVASPALLAVETPAGNFAARITALHNRERVARGVPRLAWDEGLATEARRWAARLSRMRQLAHEGEDGRAGPPQGENLWAGTRHAYSVETMAALWLGERRNFRPGRFPDNSVTGDPGDVAHYTQIVWRATGRLGCAVADDGADEYLVCRYLEAGNVVGETPL